MVYTVAKETGWKERFIAWELPIVRALEYYHAALWANGVWTVRNERTAEQELSGLLAFVDDLQTEEDI
jgi:hypothetical protein